MAKKVTFSYILKNKDRKVTESFARAKYFGVYYGKKAVFSQRVFPAGVTSAKEKILHLEEIYAQLTLAKQSTFSYTIKDKNKKITGSFSRAKYFGIYSGRKAVIKQTSFPADVRSAKEKVELLEQIFDQLIVIWLDAAKKKEKKSKKSKTKDKKIIVSAEQDYTRYVKDVNASKPVWSKMVFRHQDEILASEDSERKARAKKEKKKFRKVNRTRFSYYEIPVSTRSKIYTKFFRVRVIKSKFLDSFMEELELFVDLTKPIVIGKRDHETAANVLYQTALPHMLKTYRNIRKLRRSNIHAILRFYFSFSNNKSIGGMRGWGLPRYEILKESDVEWILKEAIHDAIENDSPRHPSIWARYLQSAHKSKLFVHGFNVQFAYKTKNTNTENINMSEYKNDFITTVK